jgi:hypothetical protein
MRRIAVNVTRDHIVRGSRGQFDRCPVALAILELLPERSLAVVDPYEIYVELLDSGVYYRAKSPGEVCEFMIAFDEGEAVSPFSFDVEFLWCGVKSISGVSA